jgi:hypothetical protein
MIVRLDPGASTLPLSLPSPAAVAVRHGPGSAERFDRTRCCLSAHALTVSAGSPPRSARWHSSLDLIDADVPALA